MECAHLKRACECLEKYGKMSCTDVLPKPEFPQLLAFGENLEYIREVLQTVNVTSDKEEYVNIYDLPDDHRFFEYNRHINTCPDCEAGHLVINKHIKKFNKDYRFEVSPHPIEELQNRKEDNTCVGRCIDN